MTKTVQELFGKDEIKYRLYDYDAIVNSFGAVILRYDYGDYQGDSYILYESNGKIGYMSFGWGSCSGCDALAACCSIHEVQELMDKLHASIKWFDSKAEAANYLKMHDWKGDWSYSNEFQSQFLDKCQKILEES